MMDAKRLMSYLKLQEKNDFVYSLAPLSPHGKQISYIGVLAARTGARVGMILSS
jgi:hypothetical protein